LFYELKIGIINCMKKIIIVCLFFFIIIQFGYADIHSNIDNERQKCLDTNFKTDFQMAQCNYIAIEQYNTEINILLQNLKNELVKSQYLALNKSQKQWEKYIESDNILLKNTLESNLYFEPYLIGSSIKFQNYRQRYQELSDLYECLKKYK